MQSVFKRQISNVDQILAVGVHVSPPSRANIQTEAPYGWTAYALDYKDFFFLSKTIGI